MSWRIRQATAEPSRLGIVRYIVGTSSEMRPGTDQISSVRRVEIRPPSVRSETVNVLRVAGAIVVIVAVYLISPSSDTSGDNRAGRNLLPYQTLVRDVPSAEQRIFRELQEGLLEAERLRSTTGKWPEVSALSADGIPPFAPDPTAKGASYRWRVLNAGVFTNYLGIPSAPDAPAWLLVIREPELGSAPDLAPDDEEHHRLTDGTVLHVSIWDVREGARVSGGLLAIQRPETEGWRQLLVGSSVPIQRVTP